MKVSVYDHLQSWYWNHDAGHGFENSQVIYEMGEYQIHSQKSLVDLNSIAFKITNKGTFVKGYFIANIEFQKISWWQEFNLDEPTENYPDMDALIAEMSETVERLFGMDENLRRKIDGYAENFKIRKEIIQSLNEEASSNLSVTS